MADIHWRQILTGPCINSPDLAVGAGIKDVLIAEADAHAEKIGKKYKQLSYCNAIVGNFKDMLEDTPCCPEDAKKTWSNVIREIIPNADNEECDLLLERWALPFHWDTNILLTIKDGDTPADSVRTLCSIFKREHGDILKIEGEKKEESDEVG